MQLGPSSRAQIPDGLIAAMTLLSEKPHQGVPTSTHTMHQGFGFVIANTALGMPPMLYDEGVGSRSTGKERDTESGNDYMFARYYNSATGRFLSPDWDAKSSDPVPYAKLDDPQSLNLYSYVRNNPLGKADPDGHDAADALKLEGLLEMACPECTPIVAAAVIVTVGVIAVKAYEEHHDTAPAAPTAPATAPGATPTTPGATPAAPIGATPAPGVKGAKAPDQVTPGVKNVQGVYDPKAGGPSQPYSAHYDEYGRQVGRTDYTSQPDPKTHTNPHHHTTTYGHGTEAGKKSGPLPGEHPKDQE